MAHTYRAVIKGDATEAVYNAQVRGFTILGIVRHGPSDGKGVTILTISHTHTTAIARWYGEPSSNPFPPGALLFYADEQTGEHRGRDVDEDFLVDDDLEGLDAFHPWSVSTLVKGLHGKPSYKYFDDFGSALAYARDRVRKGKRLRDGGKAYFILGHEADPDGVAVYRVFRTLLGAEQVPGGGRKGHVLTDKQHVERREFVIVQEPAGTHPDGKTTRWKMNWAHSVEITDAEIERVRRKPFPRR